MLSTYLDALLGAGLEIEQVAERVFRSRHPHRPLFSTRPGIDPAPLHRAMKPSQDRADAAR